MSELEMPDLLWFKVDGRTQRLRENGMLEWIYHLRPTHLHWEGPENIPFINTLRNEFVRGALLSVKSWPMIRVLCRPDCTAGTTAVQGENANAVG